MTRFIIIFFGVLLQITSVQAKDVPAYRNLYPHIVWLPQQQDKSSGEEKIQKENGCKQYCGNGFHYDRPGRKNDRQEIVCTKYPNPCGYKCTVSWKIDYLVKGTNYTCQTAVQK